MKTYLCAFLLLACTLAQADTTLPPGPVIGIGTELRSADHQPVVGHVLPGSPADKAGLRAGDRFVRINDTSVSNLPLVEVASRLRGAVGSPIRVTVSRHGGERTFVMKREILLMPGSHLPQ
jgi:C-terminal processing protease CtpA/Prc